MTRREFIAHNGATWKGQRLRACAYRRAPYRQALEGMLYTMTTAAGRRMVLEMRHRK